MTGGTTSLEGEEFYFSLFSFFSVLKTEKILTSFFLKKKLKNKTKRRRAAGCVAWLYGSDVRSLKSLAARVLGEIDVDDEAEETESDEDEDDAAA